MSRTQTCEHGHRWEAGPAVLADGATCPVCATLSAAAPARGEPAVPGYDLLGELGRGGMGVVYKARHQALKRVVALKMIQRAAGLAAEEWQSLRDRFRSEAEAVARLRHPHIVELYEVGEHQGQPFLALEFCPGGSLDRKLAGTPLPPAEAARLVEALARAVHAAHQARVVHRDLKPANVLLLEDGTPKVTDFGLAKKLDEAGLTQSGAVLGTPSYMAPEQARGRTREVGPASDVYALGAILYECLTGRPPFRAATFHETLLQVIHDDPVPPRQLQRRTPLDLDTVCLKCLQKDPAKRYASAEALADDLRAFLEHRPIKARPVGPLARGWRWCRRRPAVAALLAVALGLFAAGAGGVTWQWREALREQKDKERALGEAKDRNARLQEVLYASRVALAHRECLANNVAGARRLLEACPEERRGWEWHYVWQLCHAEERVLVGHEGAVHALAFHPDGRRVASAGKDKTVRVWDLGTGQGRVLHGHADVVRGVAFSADGKQLASGGTDKTVRLWDVATGKGRVLARLPEEVGCVAFGPGGRLAAAVGGATGAGTVLIWELPDGKEPHRLPFKERPAGLAFSADGKELAVAAHQEVTAWEVGAWKKGFTFNANGSVKGVALDAEGRRVFTAVGNLGVVVDRVRKRYDDLRGHLSAVMAVACAGGRAATGSWDGTVKLWSAEGGADAEPVTLRGHSGWVECLAFSADGRRLASGGSDGSVRVWPAGASPEYTRVLPQASAPFVSAAGIVFSPDGKRLATAGWHIDMISRHEGVTAGQALLWQLGAGPGVEPWALRGHKGEMTGLAFHPAGTLLATAAKDGKVLLWDGRTGLYRRTIVAHQGAAHAVTFLPDGTLVSAGADKKVQAWDAAAGRRLFTLEGHEKAVTCVAASADGRQLVTGGEDEAVRLWDVEGREQVWAATGHTGAVRCVGLSADGRFVASGGADGSVRVWGREDGAPAHTLLGHGGEVLSLAFHPRDGRLATAGGEKLQPGEIRLWDLASGQELLTLRNKRGAVSGVAFSPDGRRLASVDAGDLGEGEVRLWDAAPAPAPPPPRPPLKPRLRATLTGHSGVVLAVDVRPDGKQLATGSADKEVRLWDAAKGALAGRLAEHSESVMALAYSPDGRTLATGGWDKKVLLRDADTGKVRLDLGAQTDAVLALAFSPDGRALAAGFKDGRVRLWDARSGKPTRTFQAHAAFVRGVAFAPGGRMLATCTANGEVKVWGVAGGKAAVTFDTFAYAYAVAFVGDGVVATAGEHVADDQKSTGVVQLWDAGTGKLRAKLDGPTAAPPAVFGCLAAAPDGAALAAGAKDGSVWLWSPVTRRVIAKLDGHKGGVSALRFAAGGGLLASGGRDNTAKVWELRRP